MTTLRIPRAVLDAIRRHAAASYPDECCGALVGRYDPATSDASVSEAVFLANTTDAGARRRFLVRPEDYRYAEAAAHAAHAELIGFYHSHPDHPARPSRYDLDHAWPNLSYVIVAVDHARPEATTSWRLRDDRAAFEEERLEIAEPADVADKEFSHGH
jgi:proteasome lid subunit RPN8/RPN11